MPIKKSHFKPAWWLSNPHLQTLWSSFFRKLPKIKLQSDRLELNDGDFLDLAMTDIQDKPLVIILHGLEGSLKSHYIKPLIKKLDEKGYAACFAHLRGCGEALNRLPRTYHSGDTADLQSVVDYLSDKYAQGVYAVIGFSLGGNIVLKWLGEQGEKAQTKTAVAVSVPFILSHAGERLEKSFSRIYQKYLLSHCQKKYIKKSVACDMPIQVDALTLNTFYDFDDKVTAPLHGFSGADEYYQQCSSRQFLKSIKKPTLILHAKDDPFMWSHTVPTDEELSDFVELELSDSGGHVGFISGKIPFIPTYWIDGRIIKWLENLHA